MKYNINCKILIFIFLFVTSMIYSETNLPLFVNYPNLEKNLKYVELSNLPTPVTKLDNLSNSFGFHLYIKHDNIGGKIVGNINKFGVNKLRKLEFILADALFKSSKTIFTFGCVGSNHVIATAIYAKFLGFNVVAFLKPQPNSSIVRKNLLLMHDSNIKMIFYPNHNLRSIGAEYELEQYKLTHQDAPYIIPTGGTCPLGVVGYVNAVFELKKQIEEGVLPEPDFIYVPAGSLGTCTGLMLGVKAANLKSKIIPVAIEPEEYSESFEKGIADLFYQTNKFLNSLDTSFKLFELFKNEVYVNHEFAGQDYGLFTKAAVDVIKFVKEKENIVLDGIYSGKAFSALIDDANKGFLKNKTVLFWNTYCSENYEDILSNIDYKKLPECLHTYFETELQELDNIKF